MDDVKCFFFKLGNFLGMYKCDVGLVGCVCVMYVNVQIDVVKTPWAGKRIFACSEE